MPTKVYIKTYGCSFNFSDSENMAGLIKESGRYELVDDEKYADVVIVNSCTVKNKAENKLYRDINKIDKKLILAGCVPQAEKDKSKFKGFSIIGTTQIKNVVQVLDETLAGNTVQLLEKTKDSRLNIPKVRRKNIVEIVPINEGCLGSCNFCKTKFARGHLRSYKIEAIVKHIRNALNEGVKELWLTSQDTACYGYDIDTNLPNLLNEILKIKRDFKIRVGMGNPDFIPDFIDELIECFKDERIYRFLHIPIQAGSDNVLKKMRREYTIESFRNIVNKFKQEIPDFTLATDMICGYPEETDEDFEESLKIMNEFRPDVINISKFWSRPGTIAATMLQLPSETIKERSDLMVKLHHKISEENNKKWIGWSGKVLVDDIKKEKSGTVITRNNSYKMIIIKGDYKIGDELNVEVVDSTVHYLIGKVV